MIRTDKILEAIRASECLCGSHVPVRVPRDIWRDVSHVFIPYGGDNFDRHRLPLLNDEWVFEWPGIYEVHSYVGQQDFVELTHKQEFRPVPGWNLPDTAIINFPWRFVSTFRPVPEGVMSKYPWDLTGSVYATNWKRGQWCLKRRSYYFAADMVPPGQPKQKMYPIHVDEDGQLHRVQWRDWFEIFAPYWAEYAHVPSHSQNSPDDYDDL